MPMLTAPRPGAYHQPSPGGCSSLGFDDDERPRSLLRSGGIAVYCFDLATVAERAPVGPSRWFVGRCANAVRPAMDLSAGVSAVLHHPAHVAHATHAARHAGSGLLGRLGDDRFGHENVLRDRGCV